MDTSSSQASSSRCRSRINSTHGPSELTSCLKKTATANDFDRFGADNVASAPPAPPANDWGNPGASDTNKPFVSKHLNESFAPNPMLDDVLYQGSSAGDHKAVDYPKSTDYMKVPDKNEERESLPPPLAYRASLDVPISLNNQLRAFHSRAAADPSWSDQVYLPTAYILAPEESAEAARTNTEVPPLRSSNTSSLRASRGWVRAPADGSKTVPSSGLIKQRAPLSKRDDHANASLSPGRSQQRFNAQPPLLILDSPQSANVEDAVFFLQQPDGGLRVFASAEETGGPAPPPKRVYLRPERSGCWRVVAAPSASIPSPHEEYIDQGPMDSLMYEAQGYVQLHAKNAPPCMLPFYPSDRFPPPPPTYVAFHPSSHFARPQHDFYPRQAHFPRPPGSDQYSGAYLADPGYAYVPMVPEPVMSPDEESLMLDGYAPQPLLYDRRPQNVVYASPRKVAYASQGHYASHGNRFNYPMQERRNNAGPNNRRVAGRGRKKPLYYSIPQLSRGASELDQQL